MAKMSKAQARKRIHESIGKLAMVRDSGHLSNSQNEFLWKAQLKLQNMATQLK